MDSDVVTAVVSIAVGSVIAFLIAYLFHKSSGNALRVETASLLSETKKLRTMVNGLGRALEDAEMVNLKRDESGNIVEVINVRADTRTAHLKLQSQSVEVSVKEDAKVTDENPTLS